MEVLIGARVVASPTDVTAPVKFPMAGDTMMLSSAMVASVEEAVRACAGWHSKAALAHWDALATFDKLTAMLEQQQQQQPVGNTGSTGAANAGMLAAWTSAAFRGDARWWWIATGQPASGASMRWAAGYPSDTGAKPYLMAVQEGPARWAVANVAAGTMAYPLCRVAGAWPPGGFPGRLLQWRGCCGPVALAACGSKPAVQTPH